MKKSFNYFFIFFFFLGILVLPHFSFASIYIPSTHVWHMDGNFTDIQDPSLTNASSSCSGSDCATFFNSSTVPFSGFGDMAAGSGSGNNQATYAPFGNSVTPTAVSFWFLYSGAENSPVAGYGSFFNGSNAQIAYTSLSTSGCGVGNYSFSVYNSATSFNHYFCSSLLTGSGFSTWHNIIFQATGSEIDMYVDGVLAASSTSSATNLGVFNQFGNGGSYGWYYSGIDDFVAKVGSDFSAPEISSIAAGNVVCSSYADTTCSGGSLPNPTVSFVSPVNGTTTPSFNQFLINIQNPDPSVSYQVNYDYEIPNQPNYFISHNIAFNSSVSSPYTQGNASSGYILGLPYLGFTYPLSYIANGYISDVVPFTANVSLTSNGIVLATATVAFYQQGATNGINNTNPNPFVETTPLYSPTGTYEGVTTTYQPNPFTLINNSVSSTPVVCSFGGLFSSTTLEDISACTVSTFSSVAYNLFVPATSSIQVIQNSIGSFSGVFPFSAYFSIVNGVEGNITSNNISSSSTLPLQVLGLNGNYITLGTLNSSTDITALTTPAISNDVGVVEACDNGCATEKVNNLFNILTMIIWLTAGIKIVMMIVTFNY